MWKSFSTLGYTKLASRRLVSPLLTLALTAAALHAQAKPGTVLKIAAAADLQPVMPAFAQVYEKETGVKLQVSFGSSSALATQIINGAPFDVFLGADFSFPEKVVAAGLADEKNPVSYANGTLVVWARKDSPIQPLSMEKLADPRVTRVAIADEFHAPFGRAAYSAIRQLKLADALKDKLVVGENVAQASQYVESGNAQMGFISLTLASSDHMKQVGNFVRVPPVYPKIRQCGVILKTSPHLPQARAFMTWLTSPEVQENLTKFGLEPGS